MSKRPAKRWRYEQSGLFAPRPMIDRYECEAGSGLYVSAEDYDAIARRAWQLVDHWWQDGNDLRRVGDQMGGALLSCASELAAVLPPRDFDAVSKA